jgi:hypothetical protein
VMNAMQVRKIGPCPIQIVSIAAMTKLSRTRSPYYAAAIYPQLRRV